MVQRYPCRTIYETFAVVIADHYWPIDKIMLRSTMKMLELPDERGTFILRTNVANTSFAFPPVASAGVEYGSDMSLLLPNTDVNASFTLPSASKDRCLFNPGLCAIGLSVSFWFQSKSFSRPNLSIAC